MDNGMERMEGMESMKEEWTWNGWIKQTGILTRRH